MKRENKELLKAAKIALAWIDAQIMTANETTKYDHKVYARLETAIKKCSQKLKTGNTITELKQYLQS